MGQQAVTPSKTGKYAQQTKTGIIAGQQDEQPTQVSPMSVSMKLD